MTSGRLRLAAGTAALALLVGCSEAGARRAEPSPAATSQAPDQAASGVDAARRFRSARGYRATPVPARIEIPKIRVASSLDRLGRRGTGRSRCRAGGAWPAGMRSARVPATQARR
jgi:hypothetical protein